LLRKTLFGCIAARITNEFHTNRPVQVNEGWSESRFQHNLECIIRA